MVEKLMHLIGEDLVWAIQKSVIRIMHRLLPADKNGKRDTAWQREHHNGKKKPYESHG